MPSPRAAGMEQSAAMLVGGKGPSREMLRMQVPLFPNALSQMYTETILSKEHHGRHTRHMSSTHGIKVPVTVPVQPHTLHINLLSPSSSCLHSCSSCILSTCSTVLFTTHVTLNRPNFTETVWWYAMARAGKCVVCWWGDRCVDGGRGIRKCTRMP